MRYHRFYVNQPLGEEVNIEDAGIYNQIFRVFRLGTGSNVILFNCTDGMDHHYEIMNFSKKSFSLKRSASYSVPSPVKDKILAMSYIKPDNLLFCVASGVSLGVTRIVFFRSKHSMVYSVNKERVFKTITEALEQSGRADMPEVLYFDSLDDLCKHYNTKNIVFGALRVGVSREENAQLSSVDGCIVGPEGGFDEDEERLMAKYFRPVSLSGFVLRAEVACISILSKYTI